MKHGEQKKLEILDAALALWRKDPVSVTARNIGAKVNMTHSAVLYHFKGDMKDEIAEYAVEKGDSRVIVQLLATNHKAVKNLTQTERARHLAAVRGA